MWVMVLIMLTVDDLIVEHIANFETMDACFERRELLVNEIGRPIKNYQVVCVGYEDTY